MLFGRTERNPVSRFVEELPDGCVDRHVRKKTSVSEYLDSESFGGIPGGSLHRQSGLRPAGTGTTGFGRPSVPKPAIPKPSIPRAGAVAAQKNPGSQASYKVGDVVIHNAFGRGIVMSKRDTAGDCLL